MTVAEPFIECLAKAKKSAAEAKEPVAFDWGPDEVFHIAGHGAKGGVSFILINDDFLIRIRDGADGWPVSVRYLAAGLWEHGVDELRSRVFALLDFAAPDRKGIIGGLNDQSTVIDHVKRADFAIDFYSPAFTSEMSWSMVQNVVCRSEIKLMPVGSSERLETITIGQKSAVQVQVYDKGKEITDQSGKTWMFDLWKDQGWPGPEGGKAKDVWRLECRFGKDYLRQRGVNRFDDLRAALPELVAEALYSRRLCRPRRKDKNRRRWPLHPLWQMAADENNCTEMPPIGKRFTLRRERMIDMMTAQAVGVLRARAVLESDDIDPNDAERILYRLQPNLEAAADDRGAVEGLQVRYQFIDEMR